MTAETTPTAARRTIRRYAHELHPGPVDEFEIRPLEVELPYLYARALGFRFWDLGFFTEGLSKEERARQSDRIMLYIAAGERAFIADALHQGLTGQEAWVWAEQRLDADCMGEWLYERAVACGVDPERIKPYPCGPEPATHSHYETPTAGNHWRTVVTINCPKSECDECTEPVTITMPTEQQP